MWNFCHARSEMHGGDVSSSVKLNERKTNFLTISSVHKTQTTAMAKMPRTDSFDYT